MGITCGVLMFVFLALAIIAGAVAATQRKHINDQKNWENVKERMTHAGTVVTLKLDIEHIKRMTQDDITKKQIRDKEMDQVENDEWIRCFDDDSATREARTKYCGMKAENAKYEKQNKKEDWTQAADGKVNGGKSWEDHKKDQIAINEAKIESIEKF